MFNKTHITLLFSGVLIDQITKFLAQAYLSELNSIDVIPGVLSFPLVHNYGAAYGILQDHRYFLLSVSLAVILGAFWFRHDIAKTISSRWGLCFLMAGTLGNFVDRLYRGFVVDFIDIRIFPVFNLADVFIDMGLIFLVWSLFFSRERNHLSSF